LQPWKRRSPIGSMHPTAQTKVVKPSSPSAAKPKRAAPIRPSVP
jgi:hypothetical protein